MNFDLAPDLQSYPTNQLGSRILLENYFCYFAYQNICCGYSKEPSQ